MKGALVEEAAAAEAMREQTEELTHTVSVFKLESDKTVSRSAAGPASQYAATHAVSHIGQRPAPTAPSRRITKAMKYKCGGWELERVLSSWLIR
ncbi:MAG: hypothetical protein OEV23_03805 [Gallionella sp.]|nr:hypothetical protein [Gallionella sp.]